MAPTSKNQNLYRTNLYEHALKLAGSISRLGHRPEWFGQSNRIVSRLRNMKMMTKYCDGSRPRFFPHFRHPYRRVTIQYNTIQIVVYLVNNNGGRDGSPLFFVIIFMSLKKSGNVRRRRKSSCKKL